MSGMAKTTSETILGVIRKESLILDHFEIFVNMLDGGLRSPSAFLVFFSNSLSYICILTFFVICIIVN